jgi:uncharacterized membrane protein
MSAVKRLEQPRVAIPIVIGLALILRLPNVRESLWLDEVLYSTHVRMPGLAGLWHFLTTNPGGPLYPAVSFFWVALVGEHQMAIRVPSMLFGIGSIVATFLAARQFARGLAPFLAAVFLAFTPAHVWYSQEATPYAMAVCLLMTAIAMRPRVSTAPLRRGWLAAYLVTLAAACLTHYYAAVFLLPLSLLALRSPNRRAILDGHVAIVSAIATFLVLQALQLNLIAGQAFLRPFTGLEWWTLFFQWFLLGNTLWIGRVVSVSSVWAEPLHLAVQIAALGLLCVGWWTARRERDASAPAWALPLFVLVLPAVLFVVTLAGFRHFYVERYLLLALPFFAIALARGALALRAAILRAVGTAFVLTIAAASYAGWLARGDVWTVYKQNPDWRSAADFLSAQKSDGHPRILAVIPIDDFLFYVQKAMPNEPLDVVLDPQNRDPLERPDPAVDLVLVKNLYWSGGVDALIVRYQNEPRLQFLGRAAFKGVELYRFRFRG